jgi:hypothetical protein
VALYNVDEIGLYWKKVPSKTFVSHEEKRASGYEHTKDHLTPPLVEMLQEL